MRLVVDMIEFCAEEMPRWHPVSISGYHIREAGLERAAGARVHARQQVRVRRGGRGAWARRRRLRAAPVVLLQRAPRLLRGDRQVQSGSQDLGSRAARRYGARNPRSWLMRFHTQTAGVSLTAQQPEVNIVRTALEAMSAVLEGAVAAHELVRRGACAPDRARGADRAPHAAGDRARDRRRQHDRSAGRLLVRRGSDEPPREEAYDYFDRIDKLGGVIPAIKENFFQREIADASFRYQSEVEAKQRIIVGVNRYQAEKGAPDRAPARRSGARGRADRAGAGRPSAARLGRRRSGAGPVEGGGLGRGPEPDAADRRGFARVRDHGGDV